MDIHQDLIKWFRTMGYNGEIPERESLIGICNNSTKFIWEELMQNVRPKQEVETIKRNIILNRLKAGHLNKKDDFAYRIQEIEDYRQKIVLEEKLKLVKDLVQEKQDKVDTLSQNCKIKDVSIDYLKKKIKENEEKKYRLDLKKKQLQEENTEAEKTLINLKNVTPVEREESSSTKEITDILEKCAAKLNIILTETQKSVALNLQKTSSLHSVTKTKKRQDQSSVAAYLSMREKENFDEITRSCVKEPRNKENIPLNNQGCSEIPESKKRLFFDIPQVIVEDISEISFKRLSLSTNSKGSEDQYQTDYTSCVKPKKRESLGILPDGFLNNEDMDSFLENLGNISARKASDNVFNNTSENLALFMSNNSPKSNDSSDSVVFNVNKNNEAKRNQIVSVKGEIFKKELYNDIYVEKEIENLLHGNNRELIHEVLQKLIQSMQVALTKFVSVDGSMNDKKNMVNEDDVTKLQFIHLQTELKIVQQKRILKDLVSKIGRRKLQVLSSVKSKEDLTDLQNCLDINIRQVGLDASLAAMKKEINASENVESDENELQVLSSRILKVKNEIANKIKLIHVTIEDLYKTQKFLTSTKESVLSPIWHIRMFKTETEWMNPLLENLWSEEIRVLESFPWEYQRRCTFTDPKIYYRDLCTDIYPEDMKMEPEHLAMISEIMESPFSPPEAILLNILQAKMKLEVLRKLRNKDVNNIGKQYRKKYSYEELQRQESCLDFSIDKLKAIMFSSSAGKTLAVGDVIKKTMEIWMEMPMKDFISNKRIVNGQTYQFYRNKLNTFR